MARMLLQAAGPQRAGVAALGAACERRGRRPGQAGGNRLLDLLRCWRLGWRPGGGHEAGAAGARRKLEMGGKRLRGCSHHDTHLRSVKLQLRSDQPDSRSPAPPDRGASFAEAGRRTPLGVTLIPAALLCLEALRCAARSCPFQTHLAASATARAAPVCRTPAPRLLPPRWRAQCARWMSPRTTPTCWSASWGSR